MCINDPSKDCNPLTWGHLYLLKYSISSWKLKEAGNELENSSGINDHMTMCFKILTCGLFLDCNLPLAAVFMPFSIRDTMTALDTASHLIVVYEVVQVLSNISSWGKDRTPRWFKQVTVLIVVGRVIWRTARTTKTLRVSNLDTCEPSITTEMSSVCKKVWRQDFSISCSRKGKKVSTYYLFSYQVPPHSGFFS